MNKSIVVLIAALAAFALPRWASAQPQVIDRVIATVGGELLLLSELEEQLALYSSQEGRPVTPEIRCGVLENLLTTKLLVNQAKLDSVEVTDAELEGQLDARFERILGLMNNDLNQFEAYYGQTVSEVRAQFRDDLRNQLLSERMRGEIVANARITPAEVKAFFAKIPKDSLPYFNSEVELRELVYRPKVNEEQRAVALAKIEELRRRIVDEGADFAAVARANSADGSAQAGGDLGMAARGTFVPPFEAAAYRLEVDEVSDVVETQFGFHLIQLLERRGNRIHTRHILIKPKLVASDFARAERVLDSLRQQIVADSLLFRNAVSSFGDDKVQSYSNGGRMSNPASGSTFFEIADLDPVAFFAVDTLEVGDVTGPVRFDPPGGADPFYKIFQLDSRTVPHQASLALDYSKIRTAAVESKKSEILTDWVRRTIASTFVQIDRSLVRDCDLRERWFEVEVAARP